MVQIRKHNNSFTETTVSVKGTIEGVDVKASVTGSQDLQTNKSSVTTEVMAGKDVDIKAGKASTGLYVSNKSDAEQSRTDVGVKASVTTPEVNNTSFTLTIRAGTTIQDKKN